MKISINWLKELVDLKVSVEELIRLLPLRTIGLKEVSRDYFELDMKGYNRADLLSMRGAAKEISAVTNSPVNFTMEKWQIPTLSEVAVEVEDAALAPVYCLAKIEKLKVNPSPSEWNEKLQSCGIRSISNVADITNLCMLEFGQPMHAFDAEKVQGAVVVRVARDGEKITTLDNKIRELSENDLLITDEKGPIGIAGVMGGKMSEVSETTTSIFLEAAIFDPISLRKTSQRLGLYSEASKRFQHGLTKTNLLQSLSAAIKMYESLGGKLTALTLTGNLEDKPKTIVLNQEKVNSLIGIEIPEQIVKSSLESLGFKMVSHPSSGNLNWEVTVPLWRLDINIEEDVIEEVARMYGYEKIPSKHPAEVNIPDHRQNPFFRLIQNLKQALYEAGLTEVQTYAYYSTDILTSLTKDKKDLIKISNPISKETEYLRDNLWPNLVEIVGKNIRQGYKDIGIFEIGKTYSKKQEQPIEKYHLSIALMNNTDNPIEELANIAKTLSLHLGGGGMVQTELFHPKRILRLEKNGKQIGHLAEVHLRILNKLGIEKRAAVMEVDLET